ncbi:transcriptional regulator, XRE family [Xylanimonas cellulosilytica DSM 15894]|uniref:Transcriptional regulator, XRE family n=1 Tax=Xylanimonas cellulosilytica (strain DSM 15894 / JCM 12276 / CECT 5975 / KCTC 9989 / LMG 20990 / NBRC 107835 / XIL07) TaxID=446471 RepID=D1BV10_XYLCX|nr:helix-turn-helix domain-containing protein [Xylanimonas cellulosilytica]ACZ31249.1 transcriptional regulator, XRE family [Xylanimonas cellulosilytica DSM 15894]
MAGDDDVLDNVGPRLRAFRQALRLTLSDLAEQTGLTSSTISRLERSQIRPTLEQLLPLARVYGVPLDELVAAPAHGDPRVHLRPIRRDGLTFVPLGINRGQLQAYKVIYPPESRMASPRYHSHAGREWLYVLHGEVRLVLSGQGTHLVAGEAAEFDTKTPHWIGNAHATEPAEIIAIYGKHGGRMHLAEI